MLVGKFEKYYHLRYSAHQSFVGHRHNSFEINAVLSGCMEVTYGDEVFTLSSGDFFIGAPGIFHRNRMLSHGVTDFVSIHFLSAEGERIVTPSVYKMSSGDLSLIELIESEIESDENGSKYISPSARHMLEALLLRLSQKKSEPLTSDSRESELYRRAVRVMEANIGEPMTIKHISRLCGVCMTTLKKAFAECAGKGVSEYFLDMRMEEARRMLSDGAQIGSIAAALGFSSPAYFSQCFRRENGCSASSYRADPQSCAKTK